jgi:hypothetical protein
MPDNHVSPQGSHSVAVRPICEHRFDVAKVGQRFIPGLWVCRYCGQRVRRKLTTNQVDA